MTQRGKIKIRSSKTSGSTVDTEMGKRALKPLCCSAKRLRRPNYLQPRSCWPEYSVGLGYQDRPGRECTSSGSHRVNSRQPKGGSWVRACSRWSNDDARYHVMPAWWRRSSYGLIRAGSSLGMSWTHLPLDSGWSFRSRCALCAEPHCRYLGTE